jgi:hypothetical protein
MSTFLDKKDQIREELALMAHEFNKDGFYQAALKTQEAIVAVTAIGEHGLDLDGSEWKWPTADGGGEHG